MSPAITRAAPRGALVLDPPALQRRAMELLAEVDENPKRAAPRIAAAEAHLRIVLAHAPGGPRDKAQKLLDRAIELDPYRAEAYLLAALTSHRAGLLGPAIERYEQAAALAPGSVELRFHCGFALLDAARAPSLSDEEASDLAEAASDHFEAALRLDPGHVPAAVGAIESAIYGKATKLRDALPRVLSRVPPDEALRPTMTRLLYQAIFAFRVGKAKGVDQKNKKTMADVSDVARAWLARFPSDPGLLGVVGAAAAKCETAEELCAHLGDHLAAIKDGRVLRLLLRERLAEVTDPGKRLELFAGAMEQIPPLDGIAHDYLQLVHLVAKRAVAEGDLERAREAWLRCQALDPDNAATTQNLLRLEAHGGDPDRRDQLDRRLVELWTLYVELGPRPDLYLRRAAARAHIALEASLDRIGEALEKKDSQRPSVAQMTNLVHRWVRAQALARLAVEPALLADVGASLAKMLLLGEPEESRSLALPILERPLPGEAPVAYAFFRAPKDAPSEELLRARDGWRGELERLMGERREMGLPVTPYEDLLARGAQATRVLFDDDARAAYDASTCPTPQAELFRRHAEVLRQLVELSSHVADEEVAARAPLASLLASIPSPMTRPYLPTMMRDEAWLEVMMLRVRYMGIIAKGWKLLEQGDSQAAVALCAGQLADVELAGAHRLYASALLEDEHGPLWATVESILEHARTSIRLAHWSDPPQAVKDIQAFASQSVESLALRLSASRAGKLLEHNKSRDAVLALWSAYPGHRRERPPSVSPAARAFAALTPTGTPIYAFRVAQALRENIIFWYNSLHPTSRFEHEQMKTSALVVTEAAARWAKYAADQIRRDPDRPPDSERILEVIKKLLGALEGDRGRLS